MKPTFLKTMAAWLFGAGLIVLGFVWQNTLCSFGLILMVLGLILRSRLVWRRLSGLCLPAWAHVLLKARIWLLAGVLLVLSGLLISQDTLRMQWFWDNVSGFPGILCGIVLLAGVILGGSYLYEKPKKVPGIALQALLLGVELLFFVICALLGYGSTYYPAHEAGLESMKSNDQVRVSGLPETQGWLFDGPGSEDALIFYPGALVAPQAYAPLMQELAAGGLDCMLIQMPLNLAVLGKNRADAVLEDDQYGYSRWYMGGHSLGGAMAADYALDGHQSMLDGLFFLASYPTGALEQRLDVISLYGSQDKVLNMNKFSATLKDLPETAEIMCLEGGNHAGFGSYGPQKGDGQALISPQEQWHESAQLILDHLQQRESGQSIPDQIDPENDQDDSLSQSSPD